MILAGMVAADRQALICDMAETYGIFDLYAVPARLLATLAAGLRGDSRIKCKLAGVSVTPDILLLAAAVDRLSLLVWAKTKDGAAGKNRPDSIVKALAGQKETEETETYRSPEAFDLAWARIVGGGGNGDNAGESVCADCTVSGGDQ